MELLNVNINVKNSSYKIQIGNEFVKEILDKYAKESAYFIVDKNIYDLYKDLFVGDKVFVFIASEKNKNLSSLDEILKFLSTNNALRDSILVSVGGGITGDTAAFAASIYMRGIKLVQVPTTLLSMVDSSVGGKTAVNFNDIKNNIGTFYQPSEVLIDTSFLKTLSNEEFLNGFAECIKIAATSDKNFFEYLKDHKDDVLNRNEEIMEKIITSSCSLKAKIVEVDEKEAGLRKILNFGHTVAHAIETDSNNIVSHGFAVAIGIKYEMDYALKNGYTDQETYNNIINILKLYGYPIEYKIKNIDIFSTAMSKDKKAGKKGISLAITGSNMEGAIIKNVNVKELIDLFV